VVDLLLALTTVAAKHARVKSILTPFPLVIDAVSKRKVLDPAKPGRTSLYLLLCTAAEWKNLVKAITVQRKNWVASLGIWEFLHLHSSFLSRSLVYFMAMTHEHSLRLCHLFSMFRLQTIGQHCRR